MPSCRLLAAAAALALVSTAGAGALQQGQQAQRVASVWRALSQGRDAAPAVVRGAAWHLQAGDGRGEAPAVNATNSDYSARAGGSGGRALAAPLCFIAAPSTPGSVVSCVTAEVPQTCSLSCPAGYFVTGSESYTCTASTCAGSCVAAYSSTPYSYTYSYSYGPNLGSNQVAAQCSTTVYQDVAYYCEAAAAERERERSVGGGKMKKKKKEITRHAYPHPISIPSTLCRPRLRS